MDSVVKTAVDTSLRYARLRVADVARALGFYRDVLGFRAQSQADGQVALTAHGESRPILILNERPGARPKPRRSAGLYHAAILLPTRADLGRILVRLIEAGYPLQGASDHHVSEALYLADPDGNGLEIYADRPREGWRLPDGSYDITTVALDVDDLLAQPGVRAGAWAGMPTGTTLGHIHLHVADLARATAFYRDVLGLDSIMYLPDARMSFLSAGGYHHHIGLNTWAGEGAPRAPEDAAGLREYAWRVPDAAAWRATLERAREHGSLDTEPAADGPFTTAALRDPDGNRVLVSVETARLG
ncbi:MAG: VOC family protein [Anaerolineae bacterium]|nr:VOC family protein [Anaerolineae bacterium]